MHHCLLFCLLNYLGFLSLAEGLGEVIFAINAGGEMHIDKYGIRYQRDPLNNKVGVGTVSDYGKQLKISRVSPQDQILYQTERYHQETFGYDIPIKDDGEYVLVLKFSEVYFEATNKKVFDVVINNELKVVNNLDIFKNVGKGVAHDEYISLRIENGNIYFESQVTALIGNQLRVDFVKGHADNPKINAIYLMKGQYEEVPKLEKLRTEEEIMSENEEIYPRKRDPSLPPKKPSPNRKPSGPKTPDPYAEDDTSSLLPVFVAIGAALPLLFCLCKL